MCSRSVFREDGEEHLSEGHIFPNYTGGLKNVFSDEEAGMNEEGWQGRRSTGPTFASASHRDVGGRRSERGFESLPWLCYESPPSTFSGHD